MNYLALSGDSLNSTGWVGFWMMSPILLIGLGAVFHHIRKDPRGSMENIGIALFLASIAAGVVGVIVFLTGLIGQGLDNRCYDPDFRNREANAQYCKEEANVNLPD